jgi:hypothetical protein
MPGHRLTSICLFTPNYDDAPPAESCGEIDSTQPCYFGTGSGNYSTCTARGTQRCRTCAQLTYRGPFVCIYIMQNGHCNCSDVKQPDGSTSCQAGGACTYVNG